MFSLLLPQLIVIKLRMTIKPAVPTDTNGCVRMLRICFPFCEVIDGSEARVDLLRDGESPSIQNGAHHICAAAQQIVFRFEHDLAPGRV